MDFRIIQVTVQAGTAANELLAILHKQQVKLTRLHTTKQQLTFRINKKDLQKLKQARRRSKAKVKLYYINSEAVLQRTVMTVIGLLLCIIVPIVGSQYIWQINIEGATPELIKDVSNYLVDEWQLTEPIAAKSFPPEQDIRQRLMATFPELAWVHLDKQASSVHMKLQLAPKLETKEQKVSAYLVAKTAGVITHHFLTAGQMLVETNETVEVGAVLATGVIGDEEQATVTGVNGEVFADYWVETSFTIPRQMKYYTAIEGDWSIVTKTAPTDQQMSLPKWLTKYIHVVKRPTYVLQKRTLEEADLQTVILPLLQTKFLQDRPMKTLIKSEKVLHLAIDNDTVKGKVLYLVNENIAQPIPMQQGLNQ